MNSTPAVVVVHVCALHSWTSDSCPFVTLYNKQTFSILKKIKPEWNCCLHYYLRFEFVLMLCYCRTCWLQNLHYFLVSVKKWKEYKQFVIIFGVCVMSSNLVLTQFSSKKIKWVRVPTYNTMYLYLWWW